MINTVRLRNSLGLLGMLLPVIVCVLSLINGFGFPDSISATYYLDPCITPFMIILGSAGLLLISYRGYDRQDDIICTLAGVFGLLICIFPCSNNSMYDAGFITDIVGTFQIPRVISGWIHNISAVVFFLLLAYNSLFLFTKSSGEMTEKKKKRNIIFKVCGIGMVASLICIVPLSIFQVWGSTWWVEMFALSFFGVSWLTKSNVYPFLFAEK